jgi:hypothetical protein
MRTLAVILAAATLAGCSAFDVDEPPWRQSRSVDVRPRPVIGLSTNGNVYTISAHCSNNHPDLVDLRFPKRVNINLLIGTSTRRIAYGLPSVADRIDVTYDYSIPWWDHNLLTTNAVIQLTDLDNAEICRSGAFAIAGARVIAPASGATLVNGSYIDLTFFQTGGSGAWRFGHLTPDTSFTQIDTISDVVDGTNTLVWQVSVPVTNQIKLAFQSIDEPLVLATSGVLSSQ